MPDPYSNYNFLVEIDSIAQGGFQEVSGLEVTTETVDYREGGDNLTVKKLMGKKDVKSMISKGRKRLEKGDISGAREIYRKASEKYKSSGNKDKETYLKLLKFYNDILRKTVQV